MLTMIKKLGLTFLPQIALIGKDYLYLLHRQMDLAFIKGKYTAIASCSPTQALPFQTNSINRLLCETLNKEEDLLRILASDFCA